jgi:hypothetical protein
MHLPPEDVRLLKAIFIEGPTAEPYVCGRLSKNGEKAVDLLATHLDVHVDFTVDINDPGLFAARTDSKYEAGVTYRRRDVAGTMSKPKEEPAQPAAARFPASAQRSGFRIDYAPPQRSVEVVMPSPDTFATPNQATAAPKSAAASAASRKPSDRPPASRPSDSWLRLSSSANDLSRFTSTAATPPPASQTPTPAHEPKAETLAGKSARASKPQSGIALPPGQSEIARKLQETVSLEPRSVDIPRHSRRIQLPIGPKTSGKKSKADES